MTEQEILSATLDAYAERAGDARDDMLQVVERRYRIRRRRQVGASILAAAVVVALVAAGAVFKPFGGTATPAPPATWVQDGPWRIPRSSVPTGTAAQTWPRAYVTVPLLTPDRQAAAVEGAVDATHLLVADDGVPHDIYSYDTVDRTFALMVTHAPWPVGSLVVSGFAVSPHWIAWAVPGPGTDDGATIYKAPLSGGAAQKVADLSRAQLSPSILRYMTDDAIYWSGEKAGVIRLSLAGGPPVAVPGFGDFFVTDDSPWMSLLSGTKSGAFSLPIGGVTAELKNVETGATIAVHVPPHTDVLRCTPALCFGQSGVTRFLQRPDGSAHTVLPGGMLAYPHPQGMSSLDNAGDPARDGALIPGVIFRATTGAAEQYLYDPTSGAYVIVPNSGANDGTIAWPTPGNTGTSVLILSRMD